MDIEACITGLLASLHPFRAMVPTSSLVESGWVAPHSAFSRRRIDGSVHEAVIPDTSEDDRSKFVRYARSASLLEQYRREGAVSIDEAPRLVEFQTGIGPGLMGLCRADDLLESPSLEPVPHPSVVADKQRLLEATYAYLEPVVVLADLSNDHLPDDMNVVGRVGTYGTSALELSNPLVIAGRGALMAASQLADSLPKRRSEPAERFVLTLVLDKKLTVSRLGPRIVSIPSRVIESSEVVDRLQEQFTLRPALTSTDMFRQNPSELAARFAVQLPSGETFLAEAANFEKLVQELSGGNQAAEPHVAEYVFRSLLGLEQGDFYSVTREQAVNDFVDGVLMLFDQESDDDLLFYHSTLFTNEMPALDPPPASGMVMWSLKDFQG